MYVIPEIIDNTFHNSNFSLINFCSSISIYDMFISLEFSLNNKYNLRAPYSFLKLKALVSFDAEGCSAVVKHWIKLCWGKH